MIDKQDKLDKLVPCRNCKDKVSIALIETIYHHTDGFDHSHWEVRCLICGENSHIGDTADEAIEKWNRGDLY